MTHPIIEAAAQFQNDERGRKRKRMPSADARRTLERTLHAAASTEQDPIDWARRGELAVELFGYRDTFDEQAVTVIADILWAAQAHGFNPVDVMSKAWSEFHADSVRQRQAG